MNGVVDADTRVSESDAMQAISPLPGNSEDNARIEDMYCCGADVSLRQAAGVLRTVELATVERTESQLLCRAGNIE